ncbi:hypothetical protein LR48_Vigan09g060800 [Vigna angularis]|uniref:Uncharacterized protein n=1 Tax=Phaseolus angularis TaxID=3914 RepID=A0A0L9VBE5_PHAAN|nr:hypothetical protein LR48_Vigan09g060800 [Vigna angularis]
MKGDCYRELVEVFYNYLKVINGDILSRVKGVDIIVNDDDWLFVAGLKAEGCMSHEQDSKYNKWTSKKRIYKDFLDILEEMSDDTDESSEVEFMDESNLG